MRAWLRNVWDDDDHPAWKWAIGILAYLFVCGGFALAHGDTATANSSAESAETAGNAENAENGTAGHGYGTGENAEDGTGGCAATPKPAGHEEQSDEGRRCGGESGHDETGGVVERAGTAGTAPCLSGWKPDLRLTTMATATATAATIHDLRVRKCRRIVLTYYANSGFEPHIDFFISEHERLGMGPAWFYSLIYGAANFGLRVGASAPGGCAGPMDVKHYPRVLDPEANIAWHCREMAGFYARGVRGRDLCEHVFYPARPHDWGGGRFRRTEAKFRACITRGYEVGKL